MIVVIADTSGLLAAADSGHPAAEGANAVLDTAGLVVVSPVLLAELDHLARREFGEDRAFELLDRIGRWAREGRVDLPAVTADTLSVAQQVRSQYRALAVDLADAINVVIADQYQTNAVLTLDRRDFRTLRPLRQFDHFLVLPDDLDQLPLEPSTR